MIRKILYYIIKLIEKIPTYKSADKCPQNRETSGSTHD